MYFESRDKYIDVAMSPSTCAFLKEYIGIDVWDLMNVTKGDT